MKLFSLIKNFHEKIYTIDYETLSKLSSVETSQGVIGIFQRPVSNLEAVRSDNLSSSSPLILICDRIRDPGNLGSILRSAYSFGVDVLIAVETCDVWVCLRTL